jgi:maltose phosphorylase
LAKWCLEYTLDNLDILSESYEDDYERIKGLTKIGGTETAKWKDIARNIYLPYDEKRKVYLQQDGFLDKELKTVDQLEAKHRPINQHWSWDRILRSCFIKQADVLQGFYFFDDHFTKEQHERHFDFYEPMTVHESSLSPCVHSVLAAQLGRMDKAYEMYLRTSRLDLDDYNHEVEEGCHITSMAGTWMAVVEGFGGMKIEDDMLSLDGKLPSQWDKFSFKLNFRNRVINVVVDEQGTTAELLDGEDLAIKVGGKEIELAS